MGAWFWVKDPVTQDYGAFIGPLSLDVGLADMGLADMGLADMGAGSLALGDLGRGDLNRGDLGRAGLGLADMGLADMGLADMGLADMGGGDLGLGDSGLGDSADGELTTDLVEAHGFAPPNDLTAIVRGATDNCLGLTPATCHRIRLDWTRTNLGSESQYQVWRMAGSSIGTGGTMLGTVAATSGQAAFSFNDTTELPNGAVHLHRPGAVRQRAQRVRRAGHGDQHRATRRERSSGRRLRRVRGPTARGRSAGYARERHRYRQSVALSSAAPTVALSLDGSFPSLRGGKVWLNANGSFTYHRRRRPPGGTRSCTS